MADDEISSLEVSNTKMNEMIATQNFSARSQPGKRCVAELELPVLGSVFWIWTRMAIGSATGGGLLAVHDKDEDGNSVLD